MNANGQVALCAGLTGAASDRAILLGGLGGFQILASEGETINAPGNPSLAAFDGIPVVNNAGQVAFRGTTGSKSAVLANKGRGLELVACKGDAAPGAGAGVEFDSFDEPVINAAGDVAFYARLTGTGVASSNNTGLWLSCQGELQMIAREGDPAPGTGDAFGEFRSEVSGLYAQPLNVNARGQLAFAHRYTADDWGIWALDTDGILRSIAVEGQSLTLSPGDVRTVDSLSFTNSKSSSIGDAAHSGNEDGRQTGLNDLGQIAFTARFTDGTYAILVSNAVVPEPSSLLLALVGLIGIGLGLLSRRRHERT
jgi:hypothetical protein